MLLSESDIVNIINALVDSLIIIDDKGTVLLWNGSSEKIFGYNYKEVVGKNIVSLITPTNFNFSTDIPKFNFNNLPEYTDTTLELMAKSKSGLELPIEMSVINYQKSMYCLICRNITKRKSLEKALQSALKVPSGEDAYEVTGKLAKTMALVALGQQVKAIHEELIVIVENKKKELEEGKNEKFY